MEIVKADFTQTFRDLSETSLDNLESIKISETAWGLKQLIKSAKAKEVLVKYTERIKRENVDDMDRLERMQKANPRYILRNWIVQRAIEMAEMEDYSEVTFLLNLLYNPWKINKTAEEKGYASPP